MKPIMNFTFVLILSQTMFSQSIVWENIGPFGIPNTIHGSAIEGNGNGRICAIALQEGSDIVWASSPRGALWSKDFSSFVSTPKNRTV